LDYKHLLMDILKSKLYIESASLTTGLRPAVKSTPNGTGLRLYLLLYSPTIDLTWPSLDYIYLWHTCNFHLIYAPYSTFVLAKC